jgi:hypothetical protein
VQWLASFIDWLQMDVLMLQTMNRPIQSNTDKMIFKVVGREGGVVSRR